MQSFEAAGAAEPALLAAAVRALRGNVAERVDPYGPGLELARDPVRPAQIGGLDEGVQAVVRVVGDTYRLRLVTEFDTETTGPKVSVWASADALSTPMKTVGSM